ncbi:hypothetical protein N9D31_00375 [Oligoflexaceae bacterium]|nr:hypothetical protein [Oligoflexaceae bacterium]
MSLLIQTFLIGAVASVAMIGTMHLVGRFSNLRPGKVWIFGKALTAKGWSARSAETAIHIVGGGVFAAAYLLVWSMFDVPSEYYALIGLFTGLLHGAGIAMTHLSILAFDDDGHQVSLVHVLAHCIFGLVIGTGVTIADMNTNFVEQFAENYRKPLFFAQKADAKPVESSKETSTKL